jgi:peptide deformylase
MAIRDILLFPEHSDTLTTECDSVEKVDDEIRQLVDDLAETMYDAEGIGLAAPQVGVTKRVTVIDLSGPDHRDDLHVLINPEIVEAEGSSVREEGCLSFPALYGEVERAERVVVEATDREGERYEIEAEGLLAVAMQHEIDHLDGVLFLERMTPTKRRMARREYRKIRSKMNRHERRKKRESQA